MAEKASDWEESYEEARARHIPGEDVGAVWGRAGALRRSEVGPVEKGRAEQRRQVAVLRARLALDSEAKELERRRQQAENTAARFALLRDRER